MADELVLHVDPVLLGKGKGLYSESVAARAFSLISTQQLSKGVLLNSYRHIGPLEIGAK